MLKFTNIIYNSFRSEVMYIEYRPLAGSPLMFRKRVTILPENFMRPKTQISSDVDFKKFLKEFGAEEAQQIAAERKAEYTKNIRDAQREKKYCNQVLREIMKSKKGNRYQ